MNGKEMLYEFTVILTEEEKNLLLELASKEVITPGEIVGRALRTYKALGELVTVYESNKLTGGCSDL